MEDKKFSVTKNGKPLDPSLYTWDEKTATFSTNEDGLVLDFSNYSDCTFKTGWGCTFKTGSGCTFDTGSDCTFKTGWGCTFKTGSDCTFDTSSDCTFKTGWGCTFKTAWGCTFDTGWGCTFDTGSGCTFDTGSDCTFKTGSDCTFDTSSDCTFKTGWGCTFKTAWGCTFDTGSDCTFDTGSDCTFDTGSDCTFDTSSGCTFDTSSDCTFKTGWDCTFKTGSGCVVVRRDILDVLKLEKGIKYQLPPYNIKGYIKDGYYYLEDKKQYKAIVADGILSEIMSEKKNKDLTVYKVKNYGETETTYLIKQETPEGDIYSHGQTLKNAKDSLIYKISSRDTSQYENLTVDDTVTFEEAIKMYRAITGACEFGVKSFVETLPEKKKKYKISEIIKITENQFGNEEFKKFF